MKVRHCRVAGVSNPGQYVALSDSVTVADLQRAMLQVCKHDEQTAIEFDRDRVPRRVRSAVCGPDAVATV